MEPEEGLNFEEGEVIYENSRVKEWVKFWKASVIATFLLEIYAADGAPSLSWMADNWAWW
jgi:hypothetical protein